MFPKKKLYRVLSFVLVLFLGALAAPRLSAGPAPQDKEYRTVTFYVA